MYYLGHLGNMNEVHLSFGFFLRQVGGQTLNYFPVWGEAYHSYDMGQSTGNC